MHAKARRTLTIVGMGVVASAALGLSATAASAASPTDTAVPVHTGHTTTTADHQRDTDNPGATDRGQQSGGDTGATGRDSQNKDQGTDKSNDDRGSQNDTGRGSHNDGDGRNDRDGRDTRDARAHRHDRDVHAGQRVRTFTVDRYRSRHACQTAARIGQRRGYWDEASCKHVAHRNAYELTATVYQGRHRTV